MRCHNLHTATSTSTAVNAAGQIVALMNVRDIDASVMTAADDRSRRRGSMPESGREPTRLSWFANFGSQGDRGSHCLKPVARCHRSLGSCLGSRS